MSGIDLSAAIEDAARRMWRHATRDVAGGGVSREDCDRLAKHAVTASAPVIAAAVEAAVREQIALDIEAGMDRDDAQKSTDFSEGLWSGLNNARHIARGES